MKTADTVIEEIKPILMEVLGVEAAEVTPSARFEADLGGESIDLLDFAFRCEKRFGIRLHFQNLVDGDDLATDEKGLLTPESLALLKARFPWLNYVEFERHPDKKRITKTITVESLAHLVCAALAARATTLRSEK